MKEAVQAECEELTQEHEYLRKREVELGAEVVGLKAREGDSKQAEIQSTQRVEEQWQEQIQNIKDKIKQIEAEIETQERVMREKEDEEQRKYESLFKELQTRSLETIKRIK